MTLPMYGVVQKIRSAYHFTADDDLQLKRGFAFDYISHVVRI
jgi:hypothetical protein